jgi:hypothetical protein
LFLHLERVILAVIQSRADGPARCCHGIGVVDRRSQKGEVRVLESRSHENEGEIVACREAVEPVPVDTKGVGPDSVLESQSRVVEAHAGKSGEGSHA